MSSLWGKDAQKRKRFGMSTQRVAIAYFNRANTQKQKKNTQPHFKRPNNTGDKDPRLAKSFNKLAILHDAQGEYAKAADFLQKGH